MFTRKLDELRKNLKNLRTKIGSSESIAPNEVEQKLSFKNLAESQPQSDNEQQASAIVKGWPPATAKIPKTIPKSSWTKHSKMRTSPCKNMTRK